MSSTIDASTFILRDEAPEDTDAVYAVNAAAFPSEAEAGLVDALRKEAQPVISLVADSPAGIVGHILFTPVTLSGNEDLALMGLAPMAIAPAYQRQGIGGRLITAGLEACREQGALGCVVLGHPEYYPRFGFDPSVRFGIRCEFDVPEEVFMVQELVPGALQGVGGTIHYHPLFSSV